MSIVVTIENLSKCFKLYRGPKDRVKEWLHPLRKQYHQPFWALQDINFSIKKGESLGIIGRNGSGKSTLLQIITGVMSPTSGVSVADGRISALLELGTGFDMELSGRDNLYLNGSLMGFSKEQIAERVPLIEEFADIGEFIDQPVKLYSSGMFVRLAFSSAIHVDPDILIIDEALAVGDVKFQNKCYRKFHEFQEMGKTIIFVTHSTDLVAKHCDRAVLLHQGRLMMDGNPNDVINKYLELLLGIPEKKQEKESSQAKAEQPRIVNVPANSDPLFKEFLNKDLSEDHCLQNPTYNGNEHRYGDGSGKIMDYLVVGENNANPLQIQANTIIRIYAKYHFLKKVETPIFGLTLKTIDGVEVFGINTLFERQDVKPRETGEVAIVSYEFPVSLISGEYFVSLGLAESQSGEIIPLDRRYDMVHLKVYNSSSKMGIVDFDLQLQELV